MADPAKKKNAVCTKVYVDGDGAEHRSAVADAIRLEFRFKNGKTEAVAKGDNPADIEARLDWFGRSEKYGNFYAGVKGDSEAAYESFMTGRELLAGGEWSERKEGMGPRPSMLINAILAALKKAGQAIDEATEASIREEAKDKAFREAALTKPAVKAEYEGLRLAAMQARHAEAVKAAKGEKFTAADILDALPV